MAQTDDPPYIFPSEQVYPGPPLSNLQGGRYQEGFKMDVPSRASQDRFTFFLYLLDFWHATFATAASILFRFLFSLEHISLRSVNCLALLKFKNAKEVTSCLRVCFLHNQVFS